MQSVNRQIKKGNARIVWSKVEKSAILEKKTTRGLWIRSADVIPATEENINTVLNLMAKSEGVLDATV
jgi:hypothetical protein